MKELESKIKKLSKSLSTRCYLLFSELYIACLHLKVMRVYIDGVLRFGIPPMFVMSIIEPGKGYEKKVIDNLTKQFTEPGHEDMYGNKEKIGDTEDFFPFVIMYLSIQ